MMALLDLDDIAQHPTTPTDDRVSAGMDYGGLPSRRAFNFIFVSVLCSPLELYNTQVDIDGLVLVSFIWRFGVGLMGAKYTRLNFGPDHQSSTLKNSLHYCLQTTMFFLSRIHGRGRELF